MTMHLSRRLEPPLLAALAALLAAAPLTAQRVERFTLGRGANVHNVAGAVTVVPGTGNAVVVEITRGGADAGQLRVVRSGGEVRVVYPGNRVVYERMGARARSTVTVRRNGRLGGGLSARQVVVAGAGAGLRAWADVRVLVPAGRSAEVHLSVGRVSVANVAGPVQVFAHTADVDVRNTRGELTVDTQNGAVTLANVRGRTVDASARTGSVRGAGLRAEVLEVLVGTGSIHLAGVAADEVKLDARRGSVDLGLASDADLEIGTGTGSVTVTVPRTFGAMMEIQTGNGAITVDVPARNRRTGGNSFQGSVGDGRGSVDIDLGSGAVRIRRG